MRLSPVLVLSATLSAALFAHGRALADEPAAPVVELDADEAPVALERRTATSGSSGLGVLETGLVSVGHWERACVAPCQVRLDPTYSYRVAGEGLVPTGEFVLPRSNDRVRVDARMGSSPARVSGMALTGAGAFAIAAGGVALLASPILASEDVGSEGFRTAVLAGGIGAVSVGAVAATIGLFMWLTNGSSAQTRVIASSSPSSSSSSSSASR